MSTLEVVTLAAVVLLLLAWYLSYTAARLHRLQTRVEGALAALDAHLIRRAEASLELVNSRILDPATALIVASAAADSVDGSDTLTALDWAEADLAHRELIESALTQAIRLAIPGGEPGALTDSRVVGDRPQGSPPAASLDGLGAPGSLGHTPAPVHGEGELTDIAPELVISRVLDAHRRVQLSRRFYNDAVVDVQRLRRSPVVKTLRLAGHAAIPRTVEFDDDLSVSGASTG